MCEFPAVSTISTHNHAKELRKMYCSSHSALLRSAECLGHEHLRLKPTFINESFAVLAISNLIDHYMLHP
jgi:hypothetical protein